jgi:hypothetical protein
MVRVAGITHGGTSIARRNAANIDAGVSTNGANTNGDNETAPSDIIMTAIATHRMLVTLIATDATIRVREFGLRITDR